jgi:hypothetical protein
MNIDIVNLRYLDPQGRASSAYVIRTWFNTALSNQLFEDQLTEGCKCTGCCCECADIKGFVDGLYCARNKEEAFNQMFEDCGKYYPDKKIEKFEILRIDGGIENRKQLV